MIHYAFLGSKKCVFNLFNEFVLDDKKANYDLARKNSKLKNITILLFSIHKMKGTYY